MTDSKRARHDFIKANVELLKPYFRGFTGVGPPPVHINPNYREDMLAVRKIMSNAGLYKSTISPHSVYYPVGNYLRLNNLL